MLRRTVAVIDQGVDHDYLASLGLKIDEQVISDEHVISMEDPSPPAPIDEKDRSRLSHGSNMVRIIARNCPVENILSVKLMTDGKLTVDHLCKGLEFCAAREDIAIISISLGILQKQPSRELYLKCKQCHDLGKTIVAAAHFNLSLVCYPAGFRFVYGVGVGMAKRLTDYRYLGHGYINLLAKGVHQRVLGENGSMVMRGGTSYAAAAFSGTLMKLLTEHEISGQGTTGQNRIRRLISRNSTNLVSAHHHRKHNQFFETPLIKDLTGKKCLLFGTDDPGIQNFGTADILQGFVLKYPTNPGNRFDCATGPNWRLIDGALSRKLCSQVDVLLLGNFFKNPLLLNIYFGLLLIEIVLLIKKPIFITERSLQYAIRDLGEMKNIAVAASTIAHISMKNKEIYISHPI
jgi:hypothetical protein